MTQVVLLERIERLGQMGDIVTVRPGYARNFLIPQKKALRATEENLKEFEKRRKQLEADNLKRKKEAEAVKTKMEKLAINIVRQASEGGQLYGSVTAADIAHAVTEAGFTVNGAQIKLKERIKTLGMLSTQISLHPEVLTEITVNVIQSENAMLMLEEETTAETVKEEKKAVKAVKEEKKATEIVEEEKKAAKITKEEKQEEESAS